MPAVPAHTHVLEFQRGACSSWACTHCAKAVGALALLYFALTVQADRRGVQRVLGDGHEHAVCIVADEGVEAHAHRHTGAIRYKDVLRVQAQGKGCMHEHYC